MPQQIAMPPIMKTLGKHIAKLFGHEAAGGVLLLLAAAAAIVLDNSFLAHVYDRLLMLPMTFQLGGLTLEKPLLLWVNEGLMTLFFVLVGLVLKREVLEAKRFSWRQASLPAAAAFGGVLVPVLVYTAFNWSDPVAMNGWATPAAIDIAFAVGILALLGPRIPVGLKVFLLALAVIDDLRVILTIAFFYNSELSVQSLVAIGVSAAVLLGLNFARVSRLTPYVLVGIVMWVAVLKSGVHATLAGVAIAMFIPLRIDQDGQAPLVRAEQGLHGYVMLLVMPLFAFANAGLHFEALAASTFPSLLAFGIAAGLFVGKQIGVFGFAFLAVRFGLCQLPAGVTWLHIYGAAALAGVGFTMSLFIGTIAFEDPEYLEAMRTGVLCGSLLSGVFGYAILRWFAGARKIKQQ